MNVPLVLVNALALLLLAGMSDLDVTVRIAAALAIIVNLILASLKSGMAKRAVRMGARYSLLGYAATVVAWFVLAFGCGIEYSNATCDAVVEPAIYAFLIVGVAALPGGYLASLFFKSEPAR